MKRYIVSINTTYGVEAESEGQAYEKAIKTEPKSENIEFFYEADERKASETY